MENQKDPRSNFAVRHLPWLLGIGMFLVYCVTLNHWVTLLNLNQVATISGWVWQPVLSEPLLFFSTLPFRLLPVAQIPIVLNFFSAATAALSLVLLARSVAILPHDRTEIERQRERSDFSFLTGWTSYFPPILAVLLAGMQLTFWEHATSFTGENFELLPFAIIIWLLLEYRLDEAEWRLFVASLLYGLGMAENWAFIGFFPIFLTAIIWLRGLSLFKLRFLFRFLFCGFIGLSVMLVMPLISGVSPQSPLGFWPALRLSLGTDLSVIKAITYQDMRHNLLLVSLSTFLPALILSIRWKSNFGDTSHIGKQFLKYFLFIINGLMFTVCVWIMFDPPFSPRQIGFPPSLTLYYLSALSLGYFCGYFVLVFGVKPTSSRRRRLDSALPSGLMWLSPVIVASTFLTALLAVGVLIYKNLPIIRSSNDGTLSKYAQLATQSLPPLGAIILVDDDIIKFSAIGTSKQPVRSYLIQAALARQGRLEKFPVVDTGLLQWPAYQSFLHRHFPNQWPALFDSTNSLPIHPVVILKTLDQLSKSNTFCYLNPSFGYYFELFYQEPHGLVYNMKHLPDDTLLPPALDENMVAENQAFWANATESVSGSIVHALNPPDPNQPANLVDWLLMHLHIQAEPNQNAIFIGTVYSRALNYWGVELQRSSRLDAAAAQFTAAEKLNPDNINARINLAFNQALHSGAPRKVNPAEVNPDQFGKANNWNEVLDANGPFDDVSYCFINGMMLANENHYYRQAAAQFNRVRQLVPNDLETRLQLAQIYIFSRLPDRALEVLHDPLSQPARFLLTTDNSTGLNILAAAAYFLANDNDRAAELLEKEVSRHPDDEVLLQTVAQTYLMRGLYTNALHIINSKLRQNPNDFKWIYGRGMVYLKMGDYPGTISALTRVLQAETNNPTVRFNRALAYLKNDQLDAARADYLKLQTVYTNVFQVAFGLGEIAWRQHDTNEAVRNYRIYLANAPTNTAEAALVNTRYRQLTAH